MLTELCSNCKYYLKIDLKAQEWEKTKLRCKDEARFCHHDFAGNTFYDKNQVLIIKRPIFEMMTTGICVKHGEECHYQKNSWGDESHSVEDKEEPTSTNITPMTLTQIEQFFTDNNVKSVEMVRGKLLIEFNKNIEEEGTQLINQIEIPRK